MNDGTYDRLREDDALARALASVLERAESGDGTITWADVRSDVTAGQWGRLLRLGLVVGAGDRFVVENPTAAREVLADRDPARALEPTDGDRPGLADDAPSDAEADGSSWRPRDKVAGLCALALIASYQVPGARDAVGSTMHVVLGPLEAALPFALTVVVLAVGVSTASALVNRRLRDTDRMASVRAHTTAVRERLADARGRGDDAAVERLEERQRELVGEQVGLFSEMLRPMAYTVLLTAPVFLWLSWLAVAPAAAMTPTAAVFPFVGRIAWTARLVGPIQLWMLWYFVCSLVGGTATRRAVDRIAAG